VDVGSVGMQVLCLKGTSVRCDVLSRETPGPAEFCADVSFHGSGTVVSVCGSVPETEKGNLRGRPIALRSCGNRARPKLDRSSSSAFSSRLCLCERARSVEDCGFFLTILDHSVLRRLCSVRNSVPQLMLIGRDSTVVRGMSSAVVPLSK
jgi:hypothetical protein